MVGRRFWFLLKPSDIAPAEISIPKRGIGKVGAAAVAAHGILS